MDETVDTRDEEDQGDASPVGEIVDWVARGIIEGRLQPGDDLNSVDLAKRFNVSRTPVREALFVLNRERLVDWSPRRRPRVSSMSLTEVREIYQLRVLLYGQVSLAIVEHATADDIDSLWRAHARLADGRAYLTGEQFTVADAYVWATMWHERSGVKLDHLKNLMAYIARIEVRPSVQKALKDEAELVSGHRAQLAA